MPFKGEIAELVLATEGLTGTRNQSQVRPGQLIEANNITYETGTLQKEGGAAKYNASAISGTPIILGGWDWDHDGATQRQVVLTDAGDLLKDDGAGSFSTTLKAGLTVANVNPQFVEGGAEAAANNKKLFVFTGKNAVQVLSGGGATTSDLATPPVDWATSSPVFGLNHEDRIWGGGNPNDPHRLYYSDTADHEDFIGGVSGQIAVYPGEGMGLIGAVSFKGVIIAFKKPKGIYVIDTTNVTVANWGVDRLTDKVGSITPNSMFVVDNDVMYADTTMNVHLVSATEEFGNFKSSAITDLNDMNQFMRDNVNFSGLGGVQGVYYEEKREVHFGVPGVGSTINNRRLVLDLNRKGVPRFRFSDRDAATALWLRADSDGIPRLTMGDNAGFVWDLDQDTRSQDGAGYNGKFQTGADDFSSLDPVLGTINKNGKFLEVVMEPQGNFNLSADIIWDGAVRQTVQFNLGTTGAVLDSFELDTDRLADEQVRTRKRRIVGSGRRFALSGENSGNAQDFSIAKAFLHFTRGGERINV